MFFIHVGFCNESPLLPWTADPGADCYIAWAFGILASSKSGDFRLKCFAEDMLLNNNGACNSSSDIIKGSSIAYSVSLRVVVPPMGLRKLIELYITTFPFLVSMENEMDGGIAYP